MDNSCRQVHHIQHGASGRKIKDMEEKDRFLDWLWNFEFEIYKLPVPDCVIFLDMPPLSAGSL